MRTRTLRFAAAAAAATLLLAACSSTATSSDGEDVALISEGTLTVCTNPPYEPFEYEENGEIVGLDMDIVGEIAADLDLDLEIKVTAFEGIQSGADLNSNNCDIVASGITITEARAQNMDFTDPYFDADQGLLTQADAGLSTVEDLDGLRVGVQQATTGLDWAEEQGLTMVEFEDLGLQVQALRNGTVDAIINDIAVLGPFTDEGLEIGAVFPTGEQYGFGIKQGNTALLEAANATLERIKDDGTYDAIYETYIGTALAAG